MSENIKKLNKQVASFMLVSLALSAPAVANTAQITQNTMLVKNNIHQVVAKYGVPGYPIGELKPQPQDPPPVPMYAAPQVPVIKPTPIKPIMTKYGAPSLPIKRDELSPDTKENLNNSLINTDKNTNKIQTRYNIDNTAFSNKDNTTRIAENIAKNDNSVAMEGTRVQAGEFIYTNYGSYRTIEPLSYSFFK